MMGRRTKGAAGLGTAMFRKCRAERIAAFTKRERFEKVGSMESKRTVRERKAGGVA